MAHLQERSMIVYTFGPALGSIDLSPFVVKLLAWLHMAGLPHQVQAGDLRRMPFGKLPAVKLDDGTLMGDSQHIIHHLAALHHDPLNEAQWTPAERAQARAFRALFETDLYFANMHQRWMDEPNWALFKPVMAASIHQMGVPKLLLPMVLKQVRGKVKAQLHGQGIGRMSTQQIAEHGVAGYRAVADFLADKAFMLGSQPSALDATAFAFLHTLLVPPFNSPIKAFASSQANLVAYHQRMLGRFKASDATT
jgi:glutathione S-transferase